MVLAFAGDSTINKFFAILPLNPRLTELLLKFFNCLTHYKTLPAWGEFQGCYPAILGETIKTQKISGKAATEKPDDLAANFAVFIYFTVPQFFCNQEFYMWQVQGQNRFYIFKTADGILLIVYP